MLPTRKVLYIAAGSAVLIALAAGFAYLETGSIIALRVLWLAGPIALTSLLFLLVQFLLPKE
jgi:hypothetical protein